MYKLEELTKHAFFKYFKEISDIPRNSGYEKQISDYFVQFATKRNFKVTQDESLNVIITKPATKGYENVPGIILQGHMDMVCIKTNESNHNFDKDPIELKIVGDMIYGNDTSLGADDGVALAYALAILDSNELKHPQIEVILTTEEETTMKGAMDIDISSLNGKMMINLDSDHDDILLVGSAGGIITNEVLNIEWVEIPEGYESYEISVDGLLGGHSGEEIHKERGNANKLLGRVLDNIRLKNDLYVHSFDGGTSSNAIAREAKSVICINLDYLQMQSIISEIYHDIKNEFIESDKNINVSLAQGTTKINKVFSKENSNSLIDFILLVPNGVNSVSVNMDNLVESSNNLGVIRTIENKVFIETEARSCTKSKRLEIERKIEIISNLLGLEYSTRDEYPHWSYKNDSILQNLFRDTYEELFNESLKVKMVHAGLETGVFLGKNKNLDVVSYGPNAYELHTPKEHLNIPSCIKSWDMLVKVLENTINI